MSAKIQSIDQSHENIAIVKIVERRVIAELLEVGQYGFHACAVVIADTCLGFVKDIGADQIKLAPSKLDKSSGLLHNEMHAVFWRLWREQYCQLRISLQHVSLQQSNQSQIIIVSVTCRLLASVARIYVTVHEIQPVAIAYNLPKGQIHLVII